MYDPRKLLERFLLAKEAAGLSPKTLRAYRDAALRYLDWCAETGAGAFTPVAVEGFLAHLRRRGLSAASVAAYYRWLMAWFNWCEERDDVCAPLSPIGNGRRKRVPKPKVPDQQVQHVTPAEFRLLADSLPLSDWLDHRDYAIIQILFWCGVRRTECIALHTADLNFTTGILHVRAGKAGKGRVIPVSEEAQSAVMAYLDYRPYWPGPEMWLGAAGTFGVGGLESMLKRRCKLAGLRKLNPHAWRHGFAMAMLNNGADLSSVSAMLGHGSVNLTARLYARWVTTGLKREYSEALHRLQDGEPVNRK